MEFLKKEKESALVRSRVAFLRFNRFGLEAAHPVLVGGLFDYFVYHSLASKLDNKSSSSSRCCAKLLAFMLSMNSW